MFIFSYIKHTVIFFCFFISLSFFAYLLIKHSADQPNNIKQSHGILTSNGESIATRIKPVGKSYLLNTEPVKLVLNSPISIDGSFVYAKNCMMCHDSGIAGSPTLGIKSQWAIRLNQGSEILYTNAINGLQGSTGVMPAKGGNDSLTNAEVKAAVDFMLSKIE